MSLSIGRIRGLSQLSTAKGIFAIVACDQRGTIVKMLRAAGKPADFDAIVAAKLDIIGALAPDASGALLDPLYGAAQCIAHGALPGTTGLVAAVEDSGYDAEDEDRLASILDHWSVGKAKAMGAAAVKLLVYFNPRRERAAARQIALVERVAADCARLDIAFMLEPLVFPTRPTDNAETFMAEREALIIESAQVLSQLDIDLYKAEFPLHPSVSSDERAWLDSCAKLTAACRTPWALLSAGVDFPVFAKQLACACKAGASGFIAGRAIWKEAISTVDEPARRHFIGGEMVERLRQLVTIAEAQARPWSQAGESHRVVPGQDAPEGWYAAYPGVTA